MYFWFRTGFLMKSSQIYLDRWNNLILHPFCFLIVHFAISEFHWPFLVRDYRWVATRSWGVNRHFPILIFCFHFPTSKYRLSFCLCCFRLIYDFWFFGLVSFALKFHLLYLIFFQCSYYLICWFHLKTNLDYHWFRWYANQVEFAFSVWFIWLFLFWLSFLPFDSSYGFFVNLSFLQPFTATKVRYRH